MKKWGFEATLAMMKWKEAKEPLMFLRGMYELEKYKIYIKENNVEEYRTNYMV